MEIAKKEDLLKLKGGETISVDIEDTYSTIAIFISYDEKFNKITCIDTLKKGKEGKHHINYCDYDKCYILNTEQLVSTSKKVLNLGE